MTMSWLTLASMVLGGIVGTVLTLALVRSLARNDASTDRA